jgi:hypothetical protein
LDEKREEIESERRFDVPSFRRRRRHPPPPAPPATQSAQTAARAKAAQALATAANKVVTTSTVTSLYADAQRSRSFGGKRPFAGIDIHNNTGHNPHRACFSSLQEKSEKE